MDEERRGERWTRRGEERGGWSVCHNTQLTASRRYPQHRPNPTDPATATTTTVTATATVTACGRSLATRLAGRPPLSTLTCPPVEAVGAGRALCVCVLCVGSGYRSRLSFQAQSHTPTSTYPLRLVCLYWWKTPVPPNVAAYRAKGNGFVQRFWSVTVSLCGRVTYTYMCGVVVSLLFFAADSC